MLLPPLISSYFVDNYPFVEDVVRLRQNREVLFYKEVAISLAFVWRNRLSLIFSVSVKGRQSANSIEWTIFDRYFWETAFKFFEMTIQWTKYWLFEKLGDLLSPASCEILKRDHIWIWRIFSFATVSLWWILVFWTLIWMTGHLTIDTIHMSF